MSRELQQTIIDNLSWFLGALILAFFVWFVATRQADPIETRSYANVPIQFDVPQGLIVTGDPNSSATVTVRAQQSELARLSRDDVVVRAPLEGLGPGVHTVPLQASVARTASVEDTRPTQITLTLEQIVSQQKPVSIVITEPPAADISFDQPTDYLAQVTVRGAESDVSEVVSVRGEIDLSGRRRPFEAEVVLTPLDVDGDSVEDVTLEPRTISVPVNLFRRDDVISVSVQPDILFDTLPDGYSPTSISYEPQVIFLSGPASILEAIGDTVFTEPISLADHTSDFVETVPLRLPGDVLVFGGTRSVTVSIGVVPQLGILQLDDIPVEIIGQSEGLTLQYSPETLSVVLNGPRVLLDSLTAADVRAVIDVNGLQPANYELAPQIILQQGQAEMDSIITLPARVSVVVRSPQAEGTPSASPEAPVTVPATAPATTPATPSTPESP